jgi:DNA-binding CsgD family transcriptional regulator
MVVQNFEGERPMPHIGVARTEPRVDLAHWPVVGRTREVARLKESIRDRRGAVITGAAGMGKTALAAVGVEFARDQGMSVALVAGTETARRYPFGVFAALLPQYLVPVGPETHAELLRHYAREILDAAGGRPLLVFVDDAHLLDDGSNMLLHQLSLNGSVTVLACVLAAGQPGQPADDATVVLWKDQLAERIEVTALDDQAMEDLVRAVLGGPIDAASMRRFAQGSLGDPLYLRELLTGALESGTLAGDGGIWRLHGPIEPSRRLVELVTLRLGNLSEAERRALELIAFGQPLAQPALDELADRTAVESLEDRGLISSRMDGRRLQAWLSHPVLTDVVRAGISPRRERALAQALAEASGGRRQEDTLHLASLRLVGGGGSAELLLAGAKAARSQHDHALTERLARAAVENGEGFEARILAAEAAHLCGRHDDAKRELVELAHAAGTDIEKTRVALLRFDHAFCLHGTADDSAIHALLSTMADGVWRDELQARRLRLLGVTDGPRAVVEAVDVPIGRGPDFARTSLEEVVGQSLTRLGRLEQARALLAPDTGAGAPIALRRDDVSWPDRSNSFGEQALALIGLGRLQEAESLLCRARDEVATQGASREAAVVAALLGALHLEQGRVQSAFLQATSAARMFVDLGRPVAARRCYAVSATALAVAGFGDRASAALADLEALGLPSDLEYEVEVLIARAWTWAANGDMGNARKTLERAAELGQHVGDLLGATRALHGLARMGRARQVVDQLGALADQVEGPLTAARFAYAQAAVTRDSEALSDAAARFEDLGTPLYAAEALSESAVHLRRAGAAREAAAAQQRAARLLAGCEGAVTPFVRSVGARAQLTPAELDTALQAATGSTDKQIAELMNLSVRTVENRLHRAYQKLGLSHRRELADALHDLPAC